MINKKYMNFIIKELKKQDSIVIYYKPTEEEKEYLKKYNILTEIVTIQHHGFSGYDFDVEYCKYYIAC